ncbi:MAG: AbrB/MazE/SpoVT family DNA-binding domain-containing protein [Chloroflexi bacterium]|nr:AbrB/MazE/SpoVT family DNA-binding domain-containing protein [Chloroflexota bacterium]
MELAKITAKGQITIPIAVRRQLGLKEGDKILFVKQGNEIILKNPTVIAFKEAQKEFEGEADRVGLKNEDDVIQMIKELRNE